MFDRAQQQQFSDSEIDRLELPFGLFTAGETGKVSFDLLFENNRVGGDLGLVRLEGMEFLEVDSVEFKREVIQRAKSQSALDRPIFSDRAPIDGTPKTQTVQMNPRETFALVFFPESSEGAIANPTPILSLNAGKFADVGDGCTVAMDVAKSSQIDALTGQLERPYTDLIFRVEGATGQLEKLDGLVALEQDWRETSFGQDILSVTSKFVVEIQEQSIVEVEEVETEAIDLFVDAGELETDSDFESRIFHESNGESENGDREIVDDLPQGNSGKDRSEIERENNFGDAIEIEENSSSSYSTNEPIEKEIETTRSQSEQNEETEQSEIESGSYSSQTTEIEENSSSDRSTHEAMEEDIETTRSPSTQLESTQKILDHPFASGVFTVGETGEVEIDFLFDGGKNRSELAIFSLEGMGEYEFGSTKFIEEATHRALSNSQSGYVVIQDREEGAKFEGELGEKNWNKGEYKGVKTFQMEAGTQFGIMLIPNGTVKQVNKKPKIGGAKKPRFGTAQRPLFSMALAGKDYGQIADLNGEGHTFAMEDVQPTHKWFDRDYNDIIFQVKGATGTAQSFDNAINPEKDWRPTPLGQEILEYIKTPDRAPENLRLLGDRLYNPSESLSFSGWVMDADGGADIDRVDFWLQKDGGEWQNIDDAIDFSVNGDRAFFHHELDALEPGRYRLKAIPRDRGGAEGEAYEQTFTVLGDKLSNRVKWAIERSMNLDSYDPQALQATQKWLVSVRSGSSALQLAELLGAQNLGTTGRIANTHTWEFPKGTDPHAIAELLAQTVGIEYAYPLVAKEVAFFNAPTSEPFVANGSQWHLHSNGQFDANITKAWSNHGVYGNNVTVGIVDGGFSVQDSHNETHSEFLANYRQDLSRDFDEQDNTPSGLLRGTAELPRESTIFPHPWQVNHTLRSLVLGTIEQLFVEVDIDHPDIGSLDIKLVSPTGDRIDLDLDGDGEFAGELTAFNGQVADGDWKLEIINPQHTGFIKEFRLNFTTEDHHGTKVAGVAVADGRNNLGGSGVAPDAEKAFLRLGSDGLTSEEAEIGLTHEENQIDIFSSSWGLGEIFDVLPGGEIALEYGAKHGRNGLGNVHLFAAGNNQKDDWGAHRYGNVNYNAFANSRHTIAVGAIDHTGVQAGYSAPGASLIVAAHSSSGKKDGSDRPIVTTKRYSDDNNPNNDYTIRSYSETGEDFGGTSAATPLVSGVVALMLEANPNLTARDVQAILIQTAQKNDPNDSDWVQNDAGHWVNHKYGFGAVDADAAVDLAKNWVSLGQEQMVWGKARSGEFIPELEDENDLQPLTSEIEISPTTDLAVEWVEIEFVATHQYLGDLEIVLISPEGTRSVLAEQHYDARKYGPSDRFSNTYHWFFTSVRHWGESAEGRWKLQVTDRFVGNYGFDTPQEAHHANILTGWQINLYGTEPNTPPEASPLNQSHNYTEDVPLMLTPIFVTDADGDNISAVLQLSDPSAGELRSGNVISNNGILEVSGSINQINALLSTVEFVPTEHFNGDLTIATSVTDGKIGVPLKGAIALTGTPVNDAPTLEEVELSGAIAGQPLQISHADLLAASNASDVEGDAIAFAIEALNSGTLTKDGNAIALGTQISEGDVLEWTPESSGDDISAFSIKATDGMDASANAIDVTVDVAEIPKGKIGETFTIDSETAENKVRPFVTTLQDGGFIVTWESRYTASNGNFGQRYDASGKPIGKEFQINANNNYHQTRSAVSALDDGGFIATWQSYWGQDSSSTGIFAQRYDANSNPIGEEFQVNTHTFHSQETPAIATLSNGEYAIIWQSFGQDGSGRGIYGQRFDRDSNTIGTEFALNTQTEGEQRYPALTALKEGGFVATWTSESQDGNSYDIYARRYDANGNAIGQEFLVNTYRTSSQYVPAIAPLEDGSFVIAWQSMGQDDNSTSGIYGQRYDGNGDRIGGEFKVNTISQSDQLNPAIAPLSNGGFVVTWQSKGHFSGIHGQRYDSNGDRLGEEFRLDPEDYSFQIMPAVAGLPDGKFVTVWQSKANDIWDIHGQILGNDPEAESSENIAPELSLVHLNPVNASHVGSTNPATEGWIELVGSQNSVRAVDDGGVKAWHIKDISDSSAGHDSIAGYRRRISFAEATLANIYGWKISADLKLGEQAGLPNGSVTAVYHGGATAYGVGWGANSEGDLLLQFVQEDDYITRTLDGVAANEYHRTEIIFDPKTNTGKILVDGKEIVTNYTGSTASSNGAEILGASYLLWGSGWGSGTGEAYWQSVNFETLKPKATQGDPYTVTYEELLAASDATDANGDDLSFVITAIEDGTLTKNGQTVTQNATLSKGETLIWTPESAGDDISAFTVKATDGNATSSTSVSVTLDVQGIPKGAITEEIQVNTYTASSQSRPATATLADGSYVVTWQSYEQDGSSWGVFAQRYDVLGNPLGAEFQINTETSSTQEHPSIAALQDGGFIVAWESLNQDGSGKGIFAQRFDGNADRISGEFQVNTFTTGEQIYPAIASLTNGDFVITWQSEGQDGSNFGIFGQRYDSQGNTLRNEFQINTTTANDQSRPAISNLQDGEFLITWASEGQDGDFEGIYGQRYDANGGKVGGEFNLNTYSNGSQYVPTVTSLADGGFVVAWQSEGQDGSAYGIFGRRFDSNSQPVGEEFRINTEVSQHQVNPAIAPLSNGGFVVTWQSYQQDGSNYGIHGQRFDSQGLAIGDEFQINTSTNSRQILPSVTPLENDTFVVAWHSHLESGDNYSSVFSRIFGNEPETATTENIAPQLSAIALTAPEYSHQGNTDPTTEGWINMFNIQDGNILRAVDDNGIAAWSTNDDGSTYLSGGGYSRIFSAGETVIADKYGWKMSANLKIVDPNDNPGGSIQTTYQNGFDHYQIFWGSNAEGDVLIHGVTDETGVRSEYTLTGVKANEYHDYEMIFDPQTKTLKVLVDGVAIGNYGGYTASNSLTEATANQRHIFWGSSSSEDTGEAYWQSVNFETLKPKATQGNPYTITYEELLAASDATDANGDDLAFVITAIEDGTLTKNGQTVTQNTTLSKRETLTWTPDSAGNDVAAFSVKASDGQSQSANPVTVNIDVVAGNIVTNTNDSGAGSLRAAIEWANANPGIDTITFDIPTTDPGYNAATGTFTIQPLSALPDITDAIALDATTQPGFTDKPIIELDGSLAGDDVNGLTLATANSTIRGFVINSFSNRGVFVLGDNHKIVGNYIGTDVTGTIDRGNQGAGIHGYGSGHIIGGEAESDRNLISANKYGGIYVSMTDLQVINNYIGTDITGTQDLGNVFGVRFHHFPNNTLKNNVISGNDGAGIFLDGNGSENNIIQGNRIGTSADGMSAIANGGEGIRLTTSTNNIIGGTTPETRNLISGNGESGIRIHQFNGNYSTGNQVYGNYIGTDITGTRSLGNGVFGIDIRSYDNAIGGTNAGEGNVISGNTFDGVFLGGENNAVVGNLIGVDKNGMNALGNGSDGIQIGQDAGVGNNNTISGNAIAFNTKDGIFLSQGTENTFSENNIYNNDGAGITFKPNYNTNDGQVAPILTTATVNGATTKVKGTLSETPNTTYRLEFFGNPDNDGEGFMFLGSQEVTTDGSGNTSFNASLSGLVGGQFVTATATDAEGNTSRFSTGIEVELPPPPTQQVTVTVHRVAEIDDMDWFGGDADFRATIGINGTNWTSPIQHNRNDISPNWQFTQEVTGTTIPITLTIHDEDTIFGDETFADVDISPASGNTLNLTYNLQTGAITGSGINGIAGNQIQTSGNGDADRANIWFSIDASNVPPAPQPAPPSPSVFHHLNQAYNSVQGSPLEEGASVAPLRVETFEDGVLNTLGVTASAGSLAPSHSIEENGNSWQVNQESLTLTFDSDLLGALPTRAGVAVTDIANADIGTVAMEIFDSQGISLGVTQPEALGTGDRFFGVEYEGGISKVTFTANSNDWNIDHLQYG